MKQIESNRPTVDAAGLFSLSIKFLLHICQYFFQLYERHLTETQGGFFHRNQAEGQFTDYQMSFFKKVADGLFLLEKELLLALILLIV
jgi:hypothetical protein